MQNQPLQPLTIGQLLDRAFRLYRSNLVTFIGIVALVQVPAVLLGSLTSLDLLQMTADPEALMDAAQSGDFVLRALVYVVGLLVLAFLSNFSLGALARAVGMNYLGERIGIVAAYGQMSESWTSIVALIFLSGILGIVLVFGSLITIIGICSLVGVVAFFQFAIQLAIPIIVLERRGAGGALRRAWDLLRRRFWWALGFILLLTVLENIVVAGPSALVGTVLTLVSGGPATGSTVSFVGQTVVGGLMGILYLPLQYAALVLVYIDLRVRTEGLDLNLQAEALQAQPLSISTLLGRSPRPGGETLLTLDEYFMFIGASIVVIIIVGIVSTAIALIGALGALGTL